MKDGAVLTSNGQITIPQQIRVSTGMKAGDRMTFTLLSNGTVLLRVKNWTVMSLAGRLHKKGRKPRAVADLSC